MKNLMVFTIAPGWRQSAENMEASLHSAAFAPCGPTVERSIGWVPPRGEAHGPLVEVVDGQRVLTLQLESRMLPASVVRRKAMERAQQIESRTGRKPGKKERRDIQDDMRQSLLPQAFTKEARIKVWIDPKARRLMVEAASVKKADDVLGLLAHCLPGFAAMPLATTTSPQVAMARWLSRKGAPAGFSVDRDCELKAPDESKAAVRYAKHPLDIDEVRAHIKAGKQPTRVALTWGGRVSFVLTEQMALKKIEFLDVVFEDGSADDGDDDFDANVAIATAEMTSVMADLVEALDGESGTGSADGTAV
jgi:recombination associated protein RdgC